MWLWQCGELWLWWCGRKAVISIRTGERVCSAVKCDAVNYMCGAVKCQAVN